MITNYYKYYKEIKNRFILVVSAWIFCLSTCYIYKEAVLFALINSNNIFIKLTHKPYFIFTNITEIFYVYIELTLFIANQIGLVIFFYQIIMFFSLGLYKFEFIRLKKACQVFIFSWLISTLLLYNIIIPFSWDFFLSFQNDTNNIQPIEFFFEAKVTEYLSYFISLYYLCLINCQFLSILVIVLTSLNERVKKTKTFRKLFYLIFVVFSTIISPPDILSQICISGILISIYEILILFSQIKINMATN